MSELTLAQARTIAQTINAYRGRPDFNSIASHVTKVTGADKESVAEVIRFIQEVIPKENGLAISTEDKLNLQTRIQDLIDKPLNIAKELQYNYSVAKALLEQILSSEKPVLDGEEIRKTLREISRFSESMLKMQERVYNIQQMQQFQEAVLALLESQEPSLRDQLVENILEIEL